MTSRDEKSISNDLEKKKAEGSSLILSDPDRVQEYECPVCRSTLFPPVRRCENGHFVCGDCYLKLQSCGLCRGSFDYYPILGFINILEKLIIPCCYQSDGCTKIFDALHRKWHEKNCPYRPVRCRFFYGCREACNGREIELKKYKKHLYEHHHFPPVECQLGDNWVTFSFFDNDICNETTGVWPAVLFPFDKKTFIVRNVFRDGAFVTWISLIGTTDEANEYYQPYVVLNAFEETKVWSSIWADISIFSPHIQELEELQSTKGAYVSKPVAAMLRDGDAKPAVKPDDGKRYKYAWTLRIKILRRDQEIKS